MKCTINTRVMRKVKVTIPREKVAEWLRSLGCHIPVNKVNTLEVQYGYQGFHDLEVRWELDDRQEEEEVDDVRNIPPLTLPDPV